MAIKYQKRRQLLWLGVTNAKRLWICFDKILRQVKSVISDAYRCNGSA